MIGAVALAGAFVAAVPVWAPAVTGVCSAPAQTGAPPSYYAIELVPTRRVPGTGAAVGRGHATFTPSPFGVSVAPGGSYLYSLDVRVEKLQPRRSGVFAVWTADADLEQVKLLGVLDESMRIQGQVNWNKFLVVISLEASEEATGDRWDGPIVMRGMSRSGMMHTMAGHGAFEGEPCVKYGYK
jgi:hypothetical protein